jgi:hypothetical protein
MYGLLIDNEVKRVGCGVLLAFPKPKPFRCTWVV